MPLNLDPNMLLQLGSGLLSGQTTGQQLGNAAANVAQYNSTALEKRQALEQQNKTLQYLQQNAPELGAMVQAGMPPAEALKMFAQQRQEAAKTATPSFTKFDDGSYGWVNPQTRSIDIVGKTNKPLTPPSSIQEYQFAVGQGFKGTYADWEMQTRRAGATSVNIDNGAKLPAGYQWADPADPNKGVVPIKGGPAEQIPAETAGRIGLAKDALAHLDEAENFARKGGFTGPVDAGMVAIGRGEQGRLYREVRAGSEALIRMLTGAGKNQAEAEDEAYQYLPRATDDAATVVSKIQQLKRRLLSTASVVERGRGDVMGSPAPANADNDPLGLRGN